MQTKKITLHCLYENGDVEIRVSDKPFTADADDCFETKGEKIDICRRGLESLLGIALPECAGDEVVKIEIEVRSIKAFVFCAPEPKYKWKEVQTTKPTAF